MALPTVLCSLSEACHGISTSSPGSVDENPAAKRYIIWEVEFKLMFRTLLVLGFRVLFANWTLDILTVLAFS